MARQKRTPENIAPPAEAAAPLEERSWTPWEEEREQALSETPWQRLAAFVAERFGDFVTLTDCEAEYLKCGGELKAPWHSEHELVSEVANVLRVLYPAGLDLAWHRVNKIIEQRQQQRLPVPLQQQLPGPLPVPIVPELPPLSPQTLRWDGMILWYGDLELRSYQKKQGPAQKALLDALEQAGWPDHAVAVPDKYHKTLNKIVADLNSKIRDQLLVLHAAGNGKAVVFKRKIPQS